MIKTALGIVTRSRCLLLQNSRASYIRGYWPEPLTQQNLDQFLRDINYFEDPKELVNIGLTRGQNQDRKCETTTQDHTPMGSAESSEETTTDKPEVVDHLIDILARDAEIPQLNYDDVPLRGDQLIGVAMQHGIFRDLFSNDYSPASEFIHFTQEQAERMNKLVPYYWITDQPFARVNHHPRKIPPLRIFEPVVGISGRFIQSSDNNEDTTSLSSYYGNIIPAAEALNKPSIILDGKLLMSKGSDQSLTPESDYKNWVPGQVRSVNFGDQNGKLYSLALVNLDYLHDKACNLHWMLANIDVGSSDEALKFDEVCEYLPVHGIKGFGYSRYVFIVFQHDSKIDVEGDRVKSFTLDSRKFDASCFMEKHKNVNMKPVGLSWFQTVWDESSNQIFHDYLKLKSPIYEFVQPEELKRPETSYPGLVPFNVYLDHYRKKKDINEQVLLERLSNVDPLDYRDQYVPPRVPPTIFEPETNTPSWLITQSKKKLNKLGYWRGLRPASAILPLDNNADLDCPLMPSQPSRKSLPNSPNEYKPKRIPRKSGERENESTFSMLS